MSTLLRTGLAGIWLVAGLMFLHALGYVFGLFRPQLVADWLVPTCGLPLAVGLFAALSAWYLGWALGVGVGLWLGPFRLRPG